MLYRIIRNDDNGSNLICYLKDKNGLAEVTINSINSLVKDKNVSYSVEPIEDVLNIVETMKFLLDDIKKGE